MRPAPCPHQVEGAGPPRPTPRYVDEDMSQRDSPRVADRARLPRAGGPRQGWAAPPAWSSSHAPHHKWARVGTVPSHPPRHASAHQHHRHRRTHRGQIPRLRRRPAPLRPAARTPPLPLLGCTHRRRRRGSRLCKLLAVQPHQQRQVPLGLTGRGLARPRLALGHPPGEGGRDRSDRSGGGGRGGKLPRRLRRPRPKLAGEPPGGRGGRGPPGGHVRQTAMRISGRTRGTGEVGCCRWGGARRGPREGRRRATGVYTCEPLRERERAAT